jgi:hypothetical protein
VRLHGSTQRHVFQGLHDVKHRGNRAFHVGRAATNELLPIFGNRRVVWTGPPADKIRDRDRIEVTVHHNGRSVRGITERDNHVRTVMIRGDHLERQANE